MREFFPNKTLLWLNQVHSDVILDSSLLDSQTLDSNILDSTWESSLDSKIDSSFDAKSKIPESKSMQHKIKSTEILLGNGDGILCADSRFYDFRF